MFYDGFLGNLVNAGLNRKDEFKMGTDDYSTKLSDLYNKVSDVKEVTSSSFEQKVVELEAEHGVETVEKQNVIITELHKYLRL